MFGDQESATVRELMTEDPETLPARASVADAHEWLDDRGYTTAPLERDEPPYLYVVREELADALPDAADDPVGNHAEQLHLDDLLSPDLGFDGILTYLEERRFYFVGWHGDVVGVLTRSDLNRPAAHALLYTRVGELEMRLRDLVDEVADWESVLAGLAAQGSGGRNASETEYDAILEEYEEYEAADLQLRPIDYTTFWHLQTVVENDPSVVEHLPYEEPETAAETLGRVRELRNQVAHYGNVVHNMGADLVGSGRSIHELTELYGETVALNEHLREWADAETGDRPVGRA